MTHSIRNGIDDGMGNSLSPEPCALIPSRGSPIHDRNWSARADVMDGRFAADSAVV